MKVRTVITAIVALAWIFTQIATGFAHGMTSHDHQGATLQLTASHGTAHSANPVQHEDAVDTTHSHLKKQIDSHPASAALLACDTTCTAIIINGSKLGAMDLHNISDDFKTGLKQGFVELPTPPPTSFSEHIRYLPH